MERALKTLNRKVVEAKGAPITIICRSSRAACLVKLALMNLSPNKGIIGVEVLNLDAYISGLARMMGIERSVIGSLGREMILRDVLSQKTAVRLFGSSFDIPLYEYQAAFKAEIALLKEYGVSSTDFAANAPKSPNGKLLKYVYKAYGSKLNDIGAIDIEDLPDIIVAELGKDVWKRLYGPVKLYAYCPDRNPVIRKQLAKLGAEIIEEESREFTPKPDCQMVKLTARQGERLARETARMIKKAHVENETPYYRMCICLPKEEKHSRQIAEALRWAGLPTTEPIWMNLSDHPVGASILKFLDLINSSDAKVDIFQYCADPYFGIKDKNAIVAFKSLIKAQHTILKLQDWCNETQLSMRFDCGSLSSDLTASQGKRQLKTWIEFILRWIEFNKNKNSWSGYCKSTEDFLKVYYVERLDYKKEPELSASEQKALEGLNEVLTKLESSAVLMDNKRTNVDWEGFSYTLRGAILEKRILRKGADPLGVAIVEPEDTRGLDFDVIAVYEATEQCYPSISDRGGILTELERKEIIGEDKFMGSEDILKEEKADFFSFLSTSAKSITFSIPSISSDERPVNSSIWAEDAIESFETLGLKVEVLNSQRKLAGPASVADCVNEAEKDICQTDLSGDYDDLLAGFLSLKRANEADVARIKDATSNVIDKDYVWSATSLNTYLTCSLRGLVTYLHRLRDKDEYDEAISSKGIGTLIHSCLKAAVDSVMMDRDNGITSENACANAMALVDGKLAYDACASYTDTSPELWEVTSSILKGTIKEFVDEECQYLYGAGAAAKSIGSEIEINSKQKQSKLDIGGEEFEFKARIDRIDEIKPSDSGGNVETASTPEEPLQKLCAVYDYKTGKAPNSESDLQIEFYSLICSKVLDMKPCASLYLSLKKEKADRTYRDSMKRGFLLKSHKEAVGITRRTKAGKELVLGDEVDYQEKFADAEQKVLKTIKSVMGGCFLDAIKPGPSTCGYCIRGNFCWGPKLSGESDSDVEEVQQ